MSMREMEAKIQEKYLNDSQVAVFGVGAQVKDVPLHVHCGWRKKYYQVLSLNGSQREI